MSSQEPVAGTYGPQWDSSERIRPRKPEAPESIVVVCSFGKAAIFERPYENPGIGGTQLMAVSLAYTLAMRDPKRHVRLIAVSEHDIQVEFSPENLAVSRTAAPSATDTEGGAVIVTHEAFSRNPDVYAAVPNLVIWSHNLWDSLDDHVRLRSDAKYVVVSEIQALIASAARLPNCLHVIQNPINLDSIPISPRAPRNPREFVYLGNLTPAKGALTVARLWSRAAPKIAGATLHLVGGSDLYGANRQNSDTAYERQVRRALEGASDFTTIEFHGTVPAQELQQLLSRCTYGFMNPTGRTECFPTSLVELMAAGVYPLALPDWGNGELLRSFPGTLCRSLHQLQRQLVHAGGTALSGPPLSRQAVRNHVNSSIEPPHKVADRWIGVLGEGGAGCGNTSTPSSYLRLLARQPSALARIAYGRAPRWLKKAYNATRPRTQWTE